MEDDIYLKPSSIVRSFDFFSQTHSHFPHFPTERGQLQNPQVCGILGLSLSGEPISSPPVSLHAVTDRVKNFHTHGP